MSSKHYIKGHTYTIIIKHNVPTRELFKTLGIQQAYPKIKISMEVYTTKMQELLYSIELNINGNYYCCGSCNFEFDTIERTIIKDIENLTIFTEFNKFIENNETKIKHFFKETLIDIWHHRIFPHLCEI